MANTDSSARMKNHIARSPGKWPRLTPVNSAEVDIDHIHERRNGQRIIAQRLGQTGHAGLTGAHAGTDHTRGKNQQSR
ncbi:hypothetical protein D3C86_2047820 [compost metagenome]